MRWVIFKTLLIYRKINNLKNYYLEKMSDPNKSFINNKYIFFLKYNVVIPTKEKK